MFPERTGTAHHSSSRESVVVPIAAPTMPFSRIRAAPKSARTSSSRFSRSILMACFPATNTTKRPSWDGWKDHSAKSSRSVN